CASRRCTPVTRHDANHSESLDPIRSFLIDSDALKGLCTVTCAKLFHCVGVLIVNSVNLNCSAHCERNSSPMTRYVQPSSLGNPYFIVSFSISAKHAKVCDDNRAFASKIRF